MGGRCSRGERYQYRGHGSLMHGAYDSRVATSRQAWLGQRRRLSLPYGRASKLQPGHRRSRVNLRSCSSTGRLRTPLATRVRNPSNRLADISIVPYTACGRFGARTACPAPSPIAECGHPTKRPTTKSRRSRVQGSPSSFGAPSERSSQDRLRLSNDRFSRASLIDWRRGMC